MATPRRVFALAFALIFLYLAVWSLATPMYASPDEQAHVARAVALVRGELIGGTYKSASNAITLITIPFFYAEGGYYASCFAYKGTVPASCAKPLPQVAKDIPTATYVGRYPPLYYAIVGLPSLLTVSPTGVYLMRLISAFLNAIFLALAIVSVVVWSKKRLMLVGLLLAATPMTFFLGSVVNPSGLEITSAICLWCAGLVLAMEHSQSPPPKLVAVVAVAATTLLLNRGLSPLWLGLIVAILALLAGRRSVLGLARARAVRWAVVLMVPGAVFAVTWIVVAHTLDLLPVGPRVVPGETHAHLAANILGRTGMWIKEMIGYFGWLDTPSPLVTYLFWYAAIGLVVLLALSSARFRYLTGLLLTIAIVLAAPVSIVYREAERLGIVWQGRDIMPVAVGIPIMAVALLEQSDSLQWPRQRVATVLCVVIGVAQFFAFAEALRRYTVGLLGSINYFDGSWQPPLGAVSLTVGALLFMTLLLTFIRYLIAVSPPMTDQDYLNS